MMLFFLFFMLPLFCLVESFQPFLSTRIGVASSLHQKWKTSAVSFPSSSQSSHCLLLPPLKSTSSEAIPPTSTTNTAETYRFESNVARVMDIIINSLYSNKDVFLRELISNAADACDKKRFLSLTSSSSPSSSSSSSSEPMWIRVSTDRAANTLTIEDRGIGMNKQELINNLGRIAESGTKKFSESVAASKGKNKNKDDLSLIGQFGVGFYSGFLVANSMEVITKGSDGEQLHWSADASHLDQYSISSDTVSEPIVGTGTRIVLHLKEESDQYLDDNVLRALIEKYSEFIPFPIELQRNVSKPESVVDAGKPISADGSIPMKTVMKKVLEWQLINNKKPLWLRSNKECTEEDYEQFYKQTFKAFDTPMSHSHFSVEGNVDFKALLYLPSEVPYELSRDMFDSSGRSMRLYVKRVFINDKFEDLVPRWLLFMRGVVDSEDLPLNVGREILQQSRSLRIIKQRLIKKSIEMISHVADTNTTQYNTFWKHFGKYIKIGTIEDEKNRDELVPLCRFYSSFQNNNDNNNNNKMTSLPEYVSRMPSDQPNIYYIVGETRAQAAQSPTLEKLKQKGHEVLYVSEPIDEMTLQHIGKYAEKNIVDIGKEINHELTDEEKKEKELKNEASESLRTWMKLVLEDRVTRVEVSTRLIDSPATLVQSEYGMSPTMQKYLRAQTVVQSDDKGVYSNEYNQAVLEINANHPIIRHLDVLHTQRGDDEEVRNVVKMIYSTAALSAGYVLDNAVEYAKMVTKLMTDASSLA